MELKEDGQWSGQVGKIYLVFVLISRLFYFLSSLRRGDQSTVFCIVIV